MNRMS